MTPEQVVVFRQLSYIDQKLQPVDWAILKRDCPLCSRLKAKSQQNDSTKYCDSVRY